jgi:ring-1,2-phenylacetyl-CoA epoxidase subunit PaaD
MVSVRDLVAQVVDPELPVVTIAELGILRDVELAVDGHPIVTITPTYSGCPALDTIAADIVRAVPGAEVRTVLAPPWTTDWITEEGKRKLLEYGIAPPGPVGRVSLQLAVRCPQCGALDTRETSRFGSTACKAQWVCNACREPFDQIKAF